MSSCDGSLPRFVAIGRTDDEIPLEVTTMPFAGGVGGR